MVYSTNDFFKDLHTDHGTQNWLLLWMTNIFILVYFAVGAAFYIQPSLYQDLGDADCSPATT
jgi:hypothetical protein